MNRTKLKQNAKEQIKGKIGLLLLIDLIIFIFASAEFFVLSLIPVVGWIIASIIVAPAFSLSVVSVYLMIVHSEKVEITDAFCGFNDFWSAFKVTFFVSLFTFLWSLLFVIPGIIKSISYSMSMYILAENPGMSAFECIDRSERMTVEHKWELFVLSLSFIGWMLLGFLTLGIAYIWIVPYMNATFANAYESLKFKPKSIEKTTQEKLAPSIVE